MDKVKYNTLTGEFQMVPDGNTYTFRINEETFEVPIGLTWLEWLGQQDESLKDIFTSIGGVNALFFNVTEHLVMPVTPMHFYKDCPSHSVVKLDRYPVAGTQYVMPSFIFWKGTYISQCNLGAVNVFQTGAYFCNGYTETVERTGEQKPLAFTPGDVRGDAATAWFSRNFVFDNSPGPIWKTPTSNDWLILNNFRPRVLEDSVYFYDVDLCLPFGAYMVADNPDVALVVDSQYRGVNIVSCPPDVPKLVRPFLTV